VRMGLIVMAASFLLLPNTKYMSLKNANAFGFKVKSFILSQNRKKWEECHIKHMTNDVITVMKSRKYLHLNQFSNRSVKKRPLEINPMA